MREIIVLILKSFLEPLGRHRKLHATPSKGKKDRKRKRQAIEFSNEEAVHQIETPTAAASVLIGWNSTTRYLETLASSATTEASKPAPRHDGTPEERTHIAAVFLPKPKNDLLYAHLPVLALTASTAHADKPVTRLVPMPAGAEEKLANILHIPRAGVVGVMQNAPGADALIAYVVEHVEAVKVPWLEEARLGRYLATKVNPVEVMPEQRFAAHGTARDVR